MIGQGAGGWSIAVGSGDVARHPHNLFLEVLVEGGLVGLILLVMLLATALRPVSMARLRTDPFALCSLMLFANAFLNAMVSGDLPRQPDDVPDARPARTVHDTQAGPAS